MSIHLEIQKHATEQLITQRKNHNKKEENI